MDLSLSSVLIPVILALVGVPVSAATWIDLGDEGRSLYVSARMELPPVGEACALNLATSSGAQRVRLGVDAKGRYRLWLYQHAVLGDVCAPGSSVILVVRIMSHSKEPDDARLAVFAAADGIPEVEPEEWVLVNRKGWSDANLARRQPGLCSCADFASPCRNDVGGHPDGGGAG